MSKDLSNLKAKKAAKEAQIKKLQAEISKMQKIYNDLNDAKEDIERVKKDIENKICDDRPEYWYGNRYDKTMEKIKEELIDDKLKNEIKKLDDNMDALLDEITKKQNEIIELNDMMVSLSKLIVIASSEVRKTFN